MAITLAATLAGVCVHAQEPTSTLEQSDERLVRLKLGDVFQLRQNAQQANPTNDGKSAGQDPPALQSGTADPVSLKDQEGRQSKRILWIIPNYRAVSANTHLPPQSFKEKLWLATEDTFDYSDFIFVGGLAGISMAQKSYPTFGQGAAGYGRYYWHIFVDGAIENYMTEALVPVVTKEDPRYYTLGRGGFLRRTGYAVSRLFITRSDGGKNTFNISELVGAGAAAGIGNAYYPAQSNPWVKTYQRWGTQVGLDGLFNILKEFWPDINQAVFHGKY
ncbi:MAG TPA: hypothetical protein VGP19_06880 [Candidatus Acidoferrales bacterium]|jgi:hypothetical protein|nr:hypothetical protein [Candidatus Acidoferrales bacterium]